jgi:rubrerythrin
MNPIGWEIALCPITFAHNGRKKMPDREQVITGLECLITNEVDCDGCQYNEEENSSCLKNIAKDALELLKEQESEVKLSNDCGNYVCSNCGVSIKDEIDFIMDKPIQYCPSCGRKVKLDAVD